MFGLILCFGIIYRKGKSKREVDFLVTIDGSSPKTVVRERIFKEFQTGLTG